MHPFRGRKTPPWLAADDILRGKMDASGFKEYIFGMLFLKQWTEAGGPYQFAFMGAASRSLKGEGPLECPKCRQERLRAYFHMFKLSTGTGSVWVWCPACRTFCHLSRVKPHANMGKDPFAHLSLAEFAALEQNHDEPFLDRLERLWNQGTLGNG